MFFRNLMVSILMFTSVFAKDPPQIILGNLDAKIEVVVYTALTCGACAILHKEVLKKYEKTRDFRIVIRHFPLDAQSLQAAVAVECAPLDRKLAFYEEIFNRQTQLIENSSEPQALFDKIASDLKINLDCTQTQTVKQEILEDHKHIENIIEETPTFFVGDKNTPLEKRRKDVGAISIEKFDAFLRKE